MNADHIRAVREALLLKNDRTALIDAIGQLVSEPCSVASATSTLDGLLDEVVTQSPRSVVDASGQIAVLMSISDLATLLQAVAKPISFGEALKATGFVPATGARIATRVPRNSDRSALKRWSADSDKQEG